MPDLWFAVRMRLRGATLMIALSLMALAATARATPVASTEAQRQQLGRTFPEPENSTDFIHFKDELKAGWDLNNKLFPQYVDFTTVAKELGDPNAVSPGLDGLPAW